MATMTNTPMKYFVALADVNRPDTKYPWAVFAYNEDGSVRRCRENFTTYKTMAAAKAAITRQLKREAKLAEFRMKLPPVA